MTSSLQYATLFLNCNWHTSRIWSPRFGFLLVNARHDGRTLATTTPLGPPSPPNWPTWRPKEPVWSLTSSTRWVFPISVFPLLTPSAIGPWDNSCDHRCCSSNDELSCCCCSLNGLYARGWITDGNPCELCLLSTCGRCVIPEWNLDSLCDLFIRLFCCIWCCGACCCMGEGS